MEVKVSSQKAEARSTIVLIASGDVSAQRHLEVTCRSLPESVNLEVLCVSNLSDVRETVSNGNVFLVLLDESLLSPEELQNRDCLFPEHPFLQNIVWKKSDTPLSANMLGRSMKIASLTHSHLDQWNTARAAGLWH